MRSVTTAAFLLLATSPLALQVANAQERRMLVGEDEVLNVLGRRIDASFEHSPLEDVVKALQEKTLLPFRVDAAALDEAKVGADLNLSRAFRNAPLRDALVQLFRPTEIRYQVGPHPTGVEIVITSRKAAADSGTITALFPVGDLLRSDAADEDLAQLLETDVDSLIEIIRWSVASNSWSDVGGHGEINSFKDTLVVRQHFDVIESIARFLKLLKQTRAVSLASGWKTPAIASLGLGDERTAAGRAALEKTIDADIQNTPLDKALAALAATAMFDIKIDVQALNDAGLAAKELVTTCPLRRASLESMLVHTLWPYELTYTIDEGEIVVTTPECLMESTRLYPALDLACREGWLGHHWADFNPLIALIQSCVDPESWQEGNQPANGDEILGTIALAQTDDVHRSIESLFLALRLAKKKGELKDADATAPIFVESKDDALVRQALAKPLEFSFDQTPLPEVAHLLSEKTGVPFLLDERAFGDAAMPLTTPISGKSDERNLGETLRRVLLPLELTYRIFHGVAMITTVERGDETHVIGVYPVGDLAPLVEEPSDESYSGSPQDRIDELAEVVRTIGDGKTWDYEGGPGSLETHTSPRVLVVAHIEAIHAEVTALLAQLRQAPPPESEAPRSDAPARHVFRLQLRPDGESLIPADEVAKLVRKFVATETWSEPEAILEPARIALVVRQRPSVLREVRRFIYELGVLDTMPVENRQLRRGMERGDVQP